ncbi:hypothetical protein AAG570_002416 [Ranatra chinensis]|uniref:Uncharacterized protein n=1 Tax=Ranatra chinensis TaxID=642074 RepID=A0ABD0Y7G8_9HEMI
MKVSVVLVVLAVAGGFVLNLDFDGLLDGLLVEMRPVLVEKGLDRIRMPDIEENYRLARFITWNIGGSVKLSDGWLSDLTSLRRSGNITKTDNADGSFKITAAVSVNNLTVRYNTFRYNLSFLRFSDGLTVTCMRNTVQATATVNLNEICDVRLNKVRIMDLGDFKVTTDGSGLMSAIKSKIFTSVMNKNAHNVRVLVNKYVDMALKEIINSTNICTFFME